MNRVDAIIVGGGPAGLSAALLLGRARRQVVLFDEGHPRNERAVAVHGFFTRDGTPPSELRAIGRAQLAPYDVKVRDERVTSVHRVENGFAADTASGRVVGRTILIATGMKDRVPDIDGLDAIYGRSAHQCPFCDGWEERDGAFGLYGEGDEGAVAALGLVSWSADILFFNAGDAPSPPKQAALDEKNIRVVQARIARLDSKDQRLTYVVLENGERIARSALFLHCGQTAASTFATDLGCASGEKAGCVQGDAHGRTNVPGVYVAGDLHPPVQLAIVAAGEGARAAHAMVCDLREAET